MSESYKIFTCKYIITAIVAVLVFSLLVIAAFVFIVPYDVTARGCSYTIQDGGVSCGGFMFADTVKIFLDWAMIPGWFLLFTLYFLSLPIVALFGMV